ncbi:hypothetical protein BELL_0008g00220 [Botrytis elliptica]|uniref:Uncharacterized protein n=1 Tax=Botrytis elliptica TaxID=278938 RepID=A0A4Z1K4D2_9HELO|nr:hypothetical protein EAE99_000230 [Botrytis elliptica]TGO80386.1 hypothetical protein BELL_0008g00220 [Botrytis elliptica]
MSETEKHPLRIRQAASKFGRRGAILGETGANLSLLVGIDISFHSIGNRYVTLLSVAKIICANCIDKRMSGSKTGLRGDEDKV